MLSLKALRVSPFWLGAGVLVASLVLGGIGGFGGEVAVWREVAVHGQDLAVQLAEPLAEMKQQLTNQGCSQFSLAYWSMGIPTRLHVEVRCRAWMRDLPVDAGEATRGARDEFTAGGSPR